MYSLYTVLGLEENAPQAAVTKAYTQLKNKLEPKNFETGTLAGTQAALCLQAIEDAYQTLSDENKRKDYSEQWKNEFRAETTELKPKLGQLCVASGMITLEDLEKAVESQQQLDLPLGQILQERNLITQAELDGLLLGQMLIHLPADAPHLIGQRLISLGLATEDMIRIALIEQRTFSRNLEDILVNHGWAAREVLEIVLEGQKKPIP
jgi:hypothetical protein